MGDRTGTAPAQAPVRPKLKRRDGMRVPDDKRDNWFRLMNITLPPPAAQGGAGATTPMPALPTIPAPQTAAQPAPAQPVSMTPQWSSGVTIKKALKGNDLKKVCLIEIGGQDYILKGAPRDGQAFDPTNRADRSTVEDNAAAATLIRGLGLKGVRAPQIRLIDGAERAEVLTALQAVVATGGPEASDASELIDSMKNGDVQLSSLDPGGTDPNKIFLHPTEEKKKKQVLDCLRANQSDREAGWQAIVELTKNRLTFMGKKLADNEDWETRKTKVAGLQPATEADEKMINLLNHYIKGSQAEALAKEEQAEADRTANQDRLRTFAASTEGITAYAGVAIADLVTGMDDRIIGKWNGANMLFDAAANEFSCVDNNKETNMGLTNAGSAMWSEMFGSLMTAEKGPLVDVIYDSIYAKRGISEADRPGNMPGLVMTDDKAQEARTIIRDTLNDVFAKIENDAGANPVALERVAAMKEAMTLQDLLVPPPPPALMFTGAVEELSATDKVGRGFRSMVSDWFSGADKIKSALRKNPSGYRKARTDLDALINQHPEDSKSGNDRLAQHIRFLATACEFAELLDGKAAALGGVVGAPDFPADKHGRPTFDRFTKPFEEQAALWSDNLRSSDGAIAATVQASRASLDRTCTVARAKYA